MRRMHVRQQLPLAHRPPVWKQWRGVLYVVLSQLLARAGLLSASPTVRRSVAYLLVTVGLVSQVVLLLVAGYLIDLSVSLMEIWADLARKHLEITL